MGDIANQSAMILKIIRPKQRDENHSNGSDSAQASTESSNGKQLEDDHLPHVSSENSDDVHPRQVSHAINDANAHEAVIDNYKTKESRARALNANDIKVLRTELSSLLASNFPPDICSDQNLSGDGIAKKQEELEGKLNNLQFQLTDLKRNVDSYYADKIAPPPNSAKRKLVELETNSISDSGTSTNATCTTAVKKVLMKNETTSQTNAMPRPNSKMPGINLIIDNSSHQKLSIAKPEIINSCTKRPQAADTVSKLVTAPSLKTFLPSFIPIAPSPTGPSSSNLSSQPLTEAEKNTIGNWIKERSVPAADPSDRSHSSSPSQTAKNIPNAGSQSEPMLANCERAATRELITGDVDNDGVITLSDDEDEHVGNAPSGPLLQVPAPVRCFSFDHPQCLPDVPGFGYDKGLRPPKIELEESDDESGLLILRIFPFKNVKKPVNTHFLFQYTEDLAVKNTGLRTWKKVTSVNTETPGVAVRIRLRDLKPNHRYHFIVTSANATHRGLFTSCSSYIKKM